jgi:hypothetical protein
LSNKSNEPVYFDDFKVLEQGEESLKKIIIMLFGLKIAGINSNKFGEREFTIGWRI